MNTEDYYTVPDDVPGTETPQHVGSGISKRCLLAGADDRRPGELDDLYRDRAQQLHAHRYQLLSLLAGHLRRSLARVR